ncbi:MAG: AmmeMemoRadiSam system protein B [Chlorobi bacterium]|nr:AmmeMemoRadiSam system protein B [Chlorobiota bacterium]
MIRKPAVAGGFYPGDPQELENEIKLLFDVAGEKKDFDHIYGIIAPHAGYIYSGRTAAAAYKQLVGKSYETVVVVSPSHYEFFAGSSIYIGDGYETPLGTIPVNKELAEKIIAASENVFFGENGHAVDSFKREHALEVHLPFLQIALKNFKLIPIVIGNQNDFFVNDLAKGLAEIIDKQTLIVASTDLSHFYSKEEAKRLDDIFELRIKAFDYENLQADLDAEKTFACGGGGVAALLKTAAQKGIKNIEVIARSDSGDINGDFSKVVGYLSAVIYE